MTRSQDHCRPTGEPRSDAERSGETPLRRIQLIELRMLKIVDEICRKHRITYWIDGGTLLGAVRHGGFIPWDDDVDIVMPRMDFDRFVAVVEADLPDDLELEYATAAKDSDYNVPCRVRDRYSRIIDTHSPVHEQRGVFIDILPMDDFHPDQPMLGIDRMAKLIYRNLLKIHMPPLRGWSRPVAIALHAFFELFAPLMTAETPVKAWRAFARRHLIYGGFRSAGTGDPAYGFDVRWTRIFKRKDIYPTGRIAFENVEVCAPCNPDGVLRVFYGDGYMIPHPPSKRPAMHFGSIILDTRKGSSPVSVASDGGDDA